MNIDLKELEIKIEPTELKGNGIPADFNNIKELNEFIKNLEI